MRRMYSQRGVLYKAKMGKFFPPSLPDVEWLFIRPLSFSGVAHEKEMLFQLPGLSMPGPLLAEQCVRKTGKSTPM